MRRLATILVVVLAGCSSTTKVKDDSPEPVASRTPAQDPPRSENEEESPPLGKPRAKVAPSTVSLEKRSDSLLKDNPVH